jgi:D-tyrosyl-tRNA(Tyr) deacylase
MKILIQRVRHASVEIAAQITANIATGLLIFIGVAGTDDAEDINYMVEKCLNLRIFEDEQGKMNRSLKETGGEVLVISQFTLLADTRKGRRPSFTAAADPQKGELFYNLFMDKIRAQGIAVQSGQFGAMMEIELLNYGPVTIMIDSDQRNKTI